MAKMTARLLQTIAFAVRLWVLTQAYPSSGHGSDPVEDDIAGQDMENLDIACAPHLPELRSMLSPGARIYNRGSEGFQSLTLQWQKYKKPNFSIVVAVDTEDDVVQTIRFANNHHLPFLAMTGGHGTINGLEKIQDGIEIWLRNLNHVNIDRDSDTAAIGGGAITAEVSNSLWNEGKQTVHGVCECVGLLGPTLGGGHGILQGRHGLAADQLISARLVLANGTVVTASEALNVDLFWALRGAGHNFGIVTEVVFKIYDTPPGKQNWTVQSFLFDGKLTKKVFAMTKNIANIQPPGYLHQGFFVSLPAIDAEKPVLQFVTLCEDRSEATANVTASLRTLEPFLETVNGIPYLDLPAVFTASKNDPSCQKLSDTTSYLRYSIDIHSYNPDAMHKLYDAFAKGIKDEPRFNASFVLIEGYSTHSVQTVHHNSTAVPFRGQRMLISCVINFMDNDDAALRHAAIPWGQNMRTILHDGNGGCDMLTFVNYAHGDEGLQAWYGHETWRIRKLKRLKKAWDPSNRFGGYAAIPIEPTDRVHDFISEGQL